MFRKILIANRGEIAARIMRTARRMGISTVAVYSDADSDALHLREADEAVRIGPPPSAESYLKIDAIIEACRATGAEAVHPGYGFLSENPRFATALEEAGIVFIGPTPSAMAAMGDKIRSKELARAAGVSTVPGHVGVIPNAETAARYAQDIGYPVLLKASAGGGGKGMRIARSDAEIAEGFRAATSEAKSSFGDGRVFIERYVEQPRHIEIQVLGDAHGNVVFLGERECSIQRRHQKVIEEAPSPFLDEATRQAMGAEAVALARAVGYRSAGTVEFIVDRNRNFYFLEMNTRLQVEHPVTELVTGLDLVELMIRIAAGEPLPFSQEGVRLNGWALEARIYAEDPERGFLPSTGRLVRYRPPHGEQVRVDAGVYEGADIPIFYDPMIAKLVTSGASRPEAISRMREALDAFEIRGIGNNVGFLAALVGLPRFAAGELSTNFIAEEFPAGFAGAALPEETRSRLLAIAAVVQHRTEARAAGRASAQGAGDWVVVIGDERHPVRVTPEADGAHGVVLDDKEYRVALTWSPGRPVASARVDGAPLTLQVDRDGVGWRLTHGGARVRMRVLPPRVAALLDHMPVRQAPDLSRYLLSPMPGLLLALAVSEGQEVKAGEPLATVEAMKMENLLRAERDCTVSKVHAVVGDSLTVDQKILEFE